MRKYCSFNEPAINSFSEELIKRLEIELGFTFIKKKKSGRSNSIYLIFKSNHDSIEDDEITIRISDHFVLGSGYGHIHDLHSLDTNNLPEIDNDLIERIRSDYNSWCFEIINE